MVLRLTRLVIDALGRSGRSGGVGQPQHGHVEAELLAVLQISPDGAAVEIYNGPAASVWGAIAHKTMGSNRQRQIGLRRLRELQAQVPPEQQLRVH